MTRRGGDEGFDPDTKRDYPKRAVSQQELVSTILRLHADSTEVLPAQLRLPDEQARFGARGQPIAGSRLRGGGNGGGVTGLPQRRRAFTMSPIRD